MTDQDNVRELYPDPRPKNQRPVDSDEPPIIGAHQLTIEAGITYRQLDYWTRCGHLTALPRPREDSGLPRVYSLDQVPLAREMGRLIAAGLVTTPVSLVHDVAMEILAAGEAKVGDFTITPRQEPA